MNLRRLFVGLTCFLMVLLFQNCSAPFEISSEYSLSSSGREVAPVATPPATVGKTTVFMATGHMGRSVISCDQGRSWIRDHSIDDSVRCFGPSSNPQSRDCDHSQYAGRGVTESDGYFYINLGWGHAGPMLRTRDNLNFEDVAPGDWGNGIVAVGSRLITSHPPWSVSEDRGHTWIPRASSSGDTWAYDHQKIPFFKVGGKIFGGHGSQSLIVSSDGGLTWSDAGRPAGTDFSIRGFTAKDQQTFLMVGSSGSNPEHHYAAVTSNGGASWTQVELTSTAPEWGWSSLIYDGDKFMSWSNNKVLLSEDGLNWSVEPVRFTGNSIHLGQGKFAFDPVSHTFSGIIGWWGVWYEGQKAVRSTDGKTWIVLDADSFRGGHPINNMITAQVDRTVCN